MRQWLAGLVVAAGLLALPAEPGAAPDPVGAVQQARAMAAAGQRAEAARFIEAWLARNAAGTGLPDAALLRLEAARHAAGDDGDMPAARRNLGLADAMLLRLGGTLPPPLLARLQRESARSHERLGNLVAAERQLTTATKGYGPADRQPAADAANALGMVKLERAQPGEAADWFGRSAGLLGCDAPGPPPSIECTVILGNLANALATSNQLDAATKAAAAAARAAAGNGRATRVASLARAQVLLRDTDPAATEAALRDVADMAAGEDEQLRGFALYTIAVARLDRGLLPEAARAAFAADIAYRNAMGDLHPGRARVLHLLAVVDTELGDEFHATSYFDQAEAMATRSFGPGSLQGAALSLERIRLDIRRGDIPAARARLRAVQAAVAAAPEVNLVTRTRALTATGIFAEAEERDLAAVEALTAARDQLDGPLRRAATPEMGFVLLHLGRVQTRLGRFEAAAASLERGVALQDRLGASAATWKAEAVAAQAVLRLRRGDKAGALDQGRKAVAVLRTQFAEGSLGLGPVRDEAREVLATHARIALEVLGPDQGAEDAFMAAQLAFASRTGDSVRQTAARLATRDDALATLLREQEAVSDRLRQAETLLRAALLRTGPEAAAEERRLGLLRDGLTRQLQALQQRLATEHPRFAAYATAAPLTMADLRASLRADEAVLMPFDSERETLLFVATREAGTVVRTTLTHAGAAGLVARLRAGLDLTRLQAAGGKAAFDVAAAEALHDALIQPIAPMLAGKRNLVMIASGALQTVPPAVLLAPVSHEWLIRRFALSASPSPAAFVAGRTARRPGGAGPSSFLGVGDPQTGRQAAPGATRSAVPTELRQAMLRLPALPETRDELSRMAGLYPSPKTTLLLAQDATRRRLTGSDPTDFRIIAFATHAAMAGELPGLLEPAIFMTPDAADGADTGLLTASEIATMNLDADLVLLSACNTAAPDGGPMAEGFSGLARAFFQAGARALLVSHWSVSSLATARLTTDFLTRLHADPAANKPEALRAAMLAMLDGPDLHLHYPAFWAPFVVIGD